MPTSWLFPWNVPFWILTTPRSGSTWLSQLIASHFTDSRERHAYENNPRVQLLEHFRNDRNTSWLEFAKASPPAAVVHRHQLHDTAPRLTTTEILAVCPEIRFIRLRRRDITAQAVSRYIAIHTKTHAVTNEEQKANWLAHDWHPHTPDLVYLLREIQAWNHEWTAWIYDIPHLTITYEDLVNHQEQTIDDVLHYIRIPRTRELSESQLQKLDHPLTNHLTQQLHDLLTHGTTT